MHLPKSELWLFVAETLLKVIKHDELVILNGVRLFEGRFRQPLEISCFYTRSKNAQTLQDRVRNQFISYWKRTAEMVSAGVKNVKSIFVLELKGAIERSCKKKIIGMKHFLFHKTFCWTFKNGFFLLFEIVHCSYLHRTSIKWASLAIICPLRCNLKVKVLLQMNLSYCSKHRGDIIRGLFFYPPLLFSLHLSSASFGLHWARFAVTNESLQSTLVANSMLISINSTSANLSEEWTMRWMTCMTACIKEYFADDFQSVFGVYIWIVSVGLSKSQTLLILCKWPAWNTDIWGHL